MAASLQRIKRRFHAWWEGYEPPAEPEAPEIYPGAEAGPVAPDAASDEIWSPARLKVAQVLWGEGFVFPGGAEFAQELVRPFGLAKGKTLLDVGCGLGGGTRAVAQALAIAAEGLEPSATLAAAGMAACERAGIADSASVAAWDPMVGRLPDKRYDAVFVRQMLGRVADKAAMVSALGKLIGPGGQIMFVEFAYPRAGMTSPALDAWLAVEQEAAHPPVLEDVANALIKEKIDVRLAEDMGPKFRARVRAACAGLARALPGAGLSKDEARLLLREIELWTMRLAACEAGDLRIARVHGQRKA